MSQQRPHRINRLLDEMDLTPQWVRRDSPIKATPKRAAQVPTENASATHAPTSVPRSAPTHRSAPHSTAAQAPYNAPNEPQREQTILHADWHGLREHVTACAACGLCRERRQAVLGVGDEHASWLFIGEGPGAEEDARGLPFVGQAGTLLDAMLASIDLQRGQDVYIANAVKCRPPSNRTPEAHEIATCLPYLQRQIALIKPQLIVLLGRAAAHAVLKADATLASLRGQTHHYTQDGRSIPVVVTYHPAYLLRNLPDKAKAWEDLCLARRLMREIKVAGA